jgi:hypothetical protein
VNLNAEGMPCQADGDSLDTLNRVGILALTDLDWSMRLWDLYVGDGCYTRHVNANPNNVSGDQLVPVFAARMLSTRYTVATKYNSATWYFDEMYLAMLKRLGFAQNTHDTNGSRKLLPDFLLHRVLPFIARVYTPRLVWLADVALFMNTLVTVIDLRIRNNPDHVDPFVNACATLFACNTYQPTYLSKLSTRMLEAGAINDTGFQDAEMNDSSRVANGIAWYHRTASGGNPEVGIVQLDQWDETLKIARS